MITLRAKANGSGRVVKWTKFKKGVLVDQSRFSFGMTTVLTDVITDLIKKCQVLDPNLTVEPLFPNGFTNASFDICIRGKGFQVNCGRRLVRGLFPFNPFAAEFGSNFDVLVTVQADIEQTEKHILDAVLSVYQCEKVVSGNPH